MADQTLVAAAKLAARITTSAFDAQINMLLDAALLDLGVAGVTVPETLDALVQQAAITYFLLHFGQPDEYDRLKRSYDEQKAQLSTCTGYTNWGDIDG
jgi:hypothetical protein